MWKIQLVEDASRRQRGSFSALHSAASLNVSVPTGRLSGVFQLELASQPANSGSAANVLDKMLVM